jgi:hypothetical protein
VYISIFGVMAVAGSCLLMPKTDKTAAVIVAELLIAEVSNKNIERFNLPHLLAPTSELILII